jgi:glycosyltransferase involved in cell wall biosynthesis
LRAHIALDATYSIGANLTGVGVYSQAILRGLAQRRADSRFSWCYRSHRFWEARRSASPPANAYIRPLFDHFYPRADLFHGLNQRLPSGKPRRAVSTFHDLFVMGSNDFSTPDFRARFTQLARDAAKRSDLIIAVSQYTADQVIALLQVEPSRLRVVHHGLAPSIERPLLPREPIIVTVGAMQRRKNTARLVEAFEQLDAPGWRLVLAGPSGGHGADEILARIAQSPKRAAIEIPGFLSDADRQRLYSTASIFAFPSLEEGFGIPLLEAMQAGLPIVTSNTSSMPEVVGDAALCIDPLDSASLATALQRLVDDGALRESLATAGGERVRDFTWERAVARTWSVYQELLA